MARRNVVLFIVEGQRREVGIFSEISSFFFPNRDFSFAIMPAGQNIYTLYGRLRDDDFETDVVEVIKEMGIPISGDVEQISRRDVSEIYLFFDFDGQQQNLPKGVDGRLALKEMLNSFDNESENGKLYISYPMVEAIRDFRESTCFSWTNCLWEMDEVEAYKEASGLGNDHADIGKYGQQEWNSLISSFARKVCCLFEYPKFPEESIFREEVTPETIFGNEEVKYINDGKVFLLSAIPEFLLDYFPLNRWRTLLNFRKHIPDERCPLRQ